jgi:hypothetical protein
VKDVKKATPAVEWVPDVQSAPHDIKKVRTRGLIPKPKRINVIVNDVNQLRKEIEELKDMVMNIIVR